MAHSLVYLHLFNLIAINIVLVLLKFYLIVLVFLKMDVTEMFGKNGKILLVLN